MTGLWQLLLLIGEAGSLGFRAGQVSGTTLDSLTFSPHRSAFPDGASSTQGNGSNFHFIHFCILAGDSLAHHLVGASASSRQLLMKIRLLIVIAF